MEIIGQYHINVCFHLCDRERTKGISKFFSLGEEPLGQCLLSATKLALDGTADKDKHCVRFMDDLIPEVFRKVN